MAFFLTSKQLRVVHALSIARGMSDGAALAGMSQPAFSRTLGSAETGLGVSLFQRGWSGTSPTALGELVIREVRRIVDDIAEADKALSGEGRLSRFVRWRHLRAVATVTRTGSASAAARQLQVSQPAVSQAISDLSRLLPERLFHKTQTGLAPTASAETLTALWDRTHARLAGIDPILQAAGTELVGRVAVGMLPFSGQSLVLEAFADLTQRHPRVQLVAVPGGYNALAEALKRGELDLFFGILRSPSPVDGFIEEPLYEEEFVMIARKDLPVHTPPVTMEALAQEQWVVAPHGTPIRSFFDRVFRDAGIQPPAQSVEIFSFANAEQMVVHGSSIACLCYGKSGLANLPDSLQRVDVDLPNARVPIGFTRIASQELPPAVSVFIDILREKIAEAEG